LLFGAGAFKGNNKTFVFNHNIWALDSISKVYDNLKIISFPNLSFLSFLIGFLILGILIKRVLAIRPEVNLMI
jgi:hypothetical protein